MKTFFLITIIILTVLQVSELTAQTSGTAEKETVILISTGLGDIKIKLYNETPQHRDNFISLVKKHYYDSCLFHRVIANFMLQGGDPDSKNAAQGIVLGNGGPGYTIPAEFITGIIHKKGALAAARQPDNENPQKASSGSQFYIVQGRVFTNEELDMMEERMNQNIKTQIIINYINRKEHSDLKNKVDSLQRTRNIQALDKLGKDLEDWTKEDYEKAEKFNFSPEQRKVYTTLGGSPHLDGNYTVFGEVVEGLDVVDRIAAVKTNASDRPLEDISMIITISK
ncbi:MAG: peptidylprolyl isomerase [Bacteroidetes bacterium]|nr:peptidylprolyl isomerase [Bacteroidota bacterium]